VKSNCNSSFYDYESSLKETKALNSLYSVSSSLLLLNLVVSLPPLLLSLFFFKKNFNNFISLRGEEFASFGRRG
jgi:hypothetical protein